MDKVMIEFGNFVKSLGKNQDESEIKLNKLNPNLIQIVAKWTILS